jgi:transposase InsO family protein
MPFSVFTMRRFRCSRWTDPGVHDGPEHAPWRNIDAVEYATLVWGDWFNNRRLLGPIGFVPPAEYKAAYYRRPQSQAMVA